MADTPNEMPARIWADKMPPHFWTPDYGRLKPAFCAAYIRADIVEQMAEALTYVAQGRGAAIKSFAHNAVLQANAALSTYQKVISNDR